MSIKLIVMVWDSDLPRDERAIAEKFANYANDDGDGIYVGLERVAWLSKYSLRQARRITQSLADSGVLEFVGKSKLNTNQYKFHAENLPKREPFQAASIGRPKKVADIDDRDLNQEDEPENEKVADISGKVADISGKVADIAMTGDPEVKPEVKPEIPFSSVPDEWQQDALIPDQEQEPESESVSVVEIDRKTQNMRLDFIVHYFATRTKIDLPPDKTKAQKSAAAVRWWNPLRGILNRVGWDLESAVQIIDLAIKEMDADELTISAPQSIENNAVALIGKMKRRAAAGGDRVLVDENDGGVYL